MPCSERQFPRWRVGPTCGGSDVRRACAWRAGALCARVSAHGNRACHFSSGNQVFCVQNGMRKVGGRISFGGPGPCYDGKLCVCDAQRKPFPRPLGGDLRPSHVRPARADSSIGRDICRSVRRIWPNFQVRQIGVQFKIIWRTWNAMAQVLAAQWVRGIFKCAKSFLIWRTWRAKHGISACRCGVPRPR
jgi:hypothetical protein